MWLKIGNLNTHVARASDDERLWLREYLTFKDTSARYRKAREHQSMLNLFTGSFPTGLLPVVLKAAGAEGLAIETADMRICPCEPDEDADLGWLYPDQRTAVRRFADKGRGILWCPTGCLIGSTKLTIIRGKSVRLLDLETVVRKLNGEVTKNTFNNLCSWDLTVPTYTQSIDEAGVMIPNRIVRGWANGVAKVFELVTASNRSIRATAQHRFMLPDRTYVRLDALSPGDAIAVVGSVGKGAERKRLRYWNLKPDVIRTIREVGKAETFDLEMEPSAPNYIANEIVVHNSGKTEIGIGVTRLLPARWLFIVHRNGLTKQAADRYELRTPGAVVGRIGEGVWDVPQDATFVAATFQTLSKNLARPAVKGLLSWAEGLMVDECHTLPAETFWAVAMATPNAYFRVGLSGTPLARGDRKSLLSIAAIGPVVYRIKATDLIDEGRLAKPTIHFIEVKHPPTSKPTWQGVYGEAIVRSPHRNRALIKACKLATKPSFLFVNQIKHGKALEKALWREGIKCAFVWGTHSTAWREQAVKDLVGGRIDVLVTSAVFQEGVDVPELRSVIVGSGGKSVIATLQRIGRGMRIERDENGEVVSDTFEVWDIFDAGCGCKEDGGGTHNGCRWIEKHTRTRVHAYVSEGYETSVVSVFTS